jgi:hypothetical protein
VLGREKLIVGLRKAIKKTAYLALNQLEGSLAQRAGPFRKAGMNVSFLSSCLGHA